MAETGSLEVQTASPPPAARRDVRVVTQEQLSELRREQQEIYHSLRLKGSGPSQAAREIGIPRALADEWERTEMAGDPPVPAPEGNDPRAAEIRRLLRLYRDACDVARQARECTERLEHEIASLREHLQRIQAAGDGTSPPSAKLGAPSRAARSSLTTVLLARGRARQHPAPPPRA